VIPGCSKKDIQPFYEGIIFHHLSKNPDISSMWISGTSECLMNVFENLNISSYSLFISDMGEIFDNVIERVRRSRHISEINLYCTDIWHEYGITSIPEKIYGLGETKEPSSKNKIIVDAIEQCEMNFLNNFAGYPFVYERESKNEINMNEINMNERLKYIQKTKATDLNAVMLGINSTGKLVIYSRDAMRSRDVMMNTEVSKVFGNDFEVIEYSNVYDEVF
jgi:hypothetical protein